MNSRHSKKGQSLIEFAVSVMFLTVIGFASVDLARGLSTYQRMNSVGREAARIFLKANFDTGVTIGTGGVVIPNVPENTLKPQVKAKVYDLLTQAMLPDQLSEDGTVLISVARRTLQPGENTSSNDTDQIRITHQFLFKGLSTLAPEGVSRIPDTNNDKIISGPGETTPDYDGFVPIATIRYNEQLVIVEIFYRYGFLTPVPNLIPGLQLDVLYDRTVF